MSKQTITTRGLGYSLDWNSDSEREYAPCVGCGTGTKGQSAGKAKCLPCVLADARKGARCAKFPAVTTAD